jgi:hypothetical protein
MNTVKCPSTVIESAKTLLLKSKGQTGGCDMGEAEKGHAR